MKYEINTAFFFFSFFLNFVHTTPQGSVENFQEGAKISYLNETRGHI